MTVLRPGQWPDGTRPPAPALREDDADAQGEQHLALVAEQARFHVTLGAIRADLEAQPSPRAVRAAVRRWHEAITNTGEELISQRRRAG